MPFWYLIEHLNLDMHFSTSNAHHLTKRLSKGLLGIRIYKRVFVIYNKNINTLEFYLLFQRWENATSTLCTGLGFKHILFSILHKDYTM